MALPHQKTLPDTHIDGIPGQDLIFGIASCGIEFRIDAAFYTTRGFGEDEILPWDTIDVGVSKKFLLREKKCAYEARITPDCRQGCAGCGANCLLKEVECDA